MAQGSTTTDADGTTLFAGEARFDPAARIEALWATHALAATTQCPHVQGRDLRAHGGLI